jgi:hypothetical protein
LAMMAVRWRGQNPNFWYRPTCLALWAKVNRPARRVSHWASSSMVGASKCWVSSRSQRSGRTLKGPKNPR